MPTTITPKTNTTDMNPYSYQWTSEDQSALRRTSPTGEIAYVPVDPSNRDYAAFLSSGAIASPYVEPPVPAASDDDKRLAYQAEADPLFFKWQAGEGTKEAWEAKRAEIAARYA